MGIFASRRDEAPILIFCEFAGGWDQLLALDPRDNTRFSASDPIDPAYDRVAEASPAAI